MEGERGNRLSEFAVAACVGKGWCSCEGLDSLCETGTADSK